MPLDPYYVYYGIILTGSVIVAGLLLVRVLWSRSAPGKFGLLLGIVSTAEWSLTYILEIIRTDMGEKIFWAKLQYLGISFAVLGVFIFTMHYIGRGAWLTRPRLAALAVPASAGLILAWTNDWHGLIWSGIRFTNNLPFGPLDLTHGPLFYLVVIYQYALLLSTTILLLQMIARGRNFYRSQSATMLVGLLCPWIANFLYVTGLNPFPTLDLTPFAITLTNLALSISFLRYRFMDLQPVVHSSVVDAMEVGVIVLDYKERIVDINPAGLFIFQDRGNLHGQDIRLLFPNWDDWLKDHPTGEIAQEISLEFPGEKSTYSLRTTSLFDIRGGQNGRVLIISNITAQKQIQEQIAEISRMKSQLLASLGHDLRSPLGAIIGYAEMLKDGSFGSMTEAQVNASSEILDGANQLLAFFNNLVGQAQFETGKIVLREFPFEVEEVIGPLLSTLNFHAQKKGLTLEQTFDPSLPQKITGDQFWLRQIVLNLVHNAVKFTREGYVRVCFVKKSDEYWMIQVIDTGIGIPVEAQKRVFEAFEQLTSVESEKQTGFGLGLSIVAKLTSIMQGSIDLKSEEGKGTTFSVILPLKIPVEQDEHPVLA